MPASSVIGVERQVRALELRVGVEHHRAGDRCRDGSEIGDDAVIGDGKIGFQHGENAGTAFFLERDGLADGVIRCGRGNPCDHRHAARCGFEGHLHHPLLLRPIQIGKLAGGAKRRQPVNPSIEQMLDQGGQYLVHDPAMPVDR